jgi:hypothetical protein
MTRAQATLQCNTEFTGVQCHPLTDHMFVTCDNRGRVRLHDARMTFGPLSRRTNEGVVQLVSIYVHTWVNSTTNSNPVQHKNLKKGSELSQQPRV